MGEANIELSISSLNTDGIWAEEACIIDFSVIEASLAISANPIWPNKANLVSCSIVR